MPASALLQRLFLPCFAPSVAIALTCGTAAPLHAQQPVVDSASAAAAASPEPFDGISLTATQRAAIDADWETRRPALRVLQEQARTEGRLTEARRAELRAFAEARNAAVRAILTAEQNAQLDRNLSRMNDLRRQQADARRGQR